MNIDGLPISKSGSLSTSLWPVLCKVFDKPEFGVFPVALCVTSAKPSNLDFLTDTISEIKSMTDNGVMLNDTTIPVELFEVVCDAPAKAMCKSTKSFSGYFGCDKCTIKGTYLNKFQKLTYPDVEGLQVRTDQQFRSQSNQEHHTGVSPFVSIPDLDMINAFPIDYMHQVLLGVQRRLLNIWVKEAKGRGRLPSQKITAVSERLSKLAPNCPKELARKPRSLAHLANYKATEFRSFLLYTGKVVLCDFLSKEKYTHFLCLSVAITILLNTDLAKEYADYAHDLRVYFVTNVKPLYGEQHLVYNIHSLLHLSQQTKIYGNLNLCSAFDFENHMKVYKKIIRQRKNPLVEIVRRLHELQSLELGEATSCKQPKLTCKPPDNMYITTAGDIVELLQQRYITGDNGVVQRMYRCRKYFSKTDYFVNPCPSSIIGIYSIDPKSTGICFIPAASVAHKCFKMVLDNLIVVQRLVHEL